MRQLLLLFIVFIPLYSSINHSDLQHKEILLSPEVKPQFICSFGLDSFLIVEQNSDTIMKVNKNGTISEPFNNTNGKITNIAANRTHEYLAFISNNQLTLYDTIHNKLVGFIAFCNNITSLEWSDNIIIARKKNSASHAICLHNFLNNIYLETDIIANNIPRTISFGGNQPDMQADKLEGFTTNIMEKIIPLSLRIPITLNNYIKAHFSPTDDLIALTTDIATSYNIYSLLTQKSYKITSINQEEIRTVKCMKFNSEGILAILYLAHEKPDPFKRTNYSNLALKLMIQKNFDQTKLTPKDSINYSTTNTILSTFDIESSHNYSCDNIHVIDKKAHLCDNHAMDFSCSRIAILSPTKITIIPIDK